MTEVDTRPFTTLFYKNIMISNLLIPPRYAHAAPFTLYKNIYISYKNIYISASASAGTTYTKIYIILSYFTFKLSIAVMNV